jgi:methylase of polypeptide subunit release factors
MSAVSKAIEFYYKYAREWNNDATYFFESGFYQWMEEQIRTQHYVLEIGCGTGASTEVLLSNSHKVIAIEENPSCLEETYMRLRKNIMLKKSVPR